MLSRVEAKGHEWMRTTNLFLCCLYRNFVENGEMVDVERF